MANKNRHPAVKQAVEAARELVRRVLDGRYDPVLPYSVAQFRRGAIVMGFGWEDERLDMQKAGFKSMKEAESLLDCYGEAGNLALLPLLDDTEHEARYFAATRLLKAKVQPERAMAVIKDLALHSTTHVSFNADLLYKDYMTGKLTL